MASVIPDHETNAEQSANLVPPSSGARQHVTADQAGPTLVPLLAEISLVDGEDGHGGAFDREIMSANGIDNYTLVKAVTNALKPFGLLLKDGHGVALVMHQDGEASIIGLKKGGAA